MRRIRNQRSYVESDTEDALLLRISLAMLLPFAGLCAGQAPRSGLDSNEDALVREEIQKRYMEIDRAHNTKAFDALRSIVTTDAVVGSAFLTVPFDEALQQIKSGLSAASNIVCKTEITSMERRGDQISVRARANMTLTMGGAAITRESTNSDTWVRRNGLWLLKQALMESGRESVPATDGETADRIAAEIAKQSTLLTTTEPGKPHLDLEAFGKAVGDARIVSLGEATHGSREIFRMKHRLLEYLVKEKGFTVFAMEANWPESQAADRYIKTGEGDPKDALAAMYFWTWQTEEVLDLVVWMRAFNKASPGRTLSFSSFDMQTYKFARDTVMDYVAKNAPADAGVVKAAYSDLFTLPERVRAVPGFEEAAKKAETVVSLLEARRADLVKATSSAAFRDAVQAARIAAQAARMRTTLAGSSYRDEMMAKNVEWLAREAHPKEKIVLWAHNGHVGKSEGAGWHPMGEWLRRSFGTAVYVVGFGIHTGTVRASTTERGQPIGLAESLIPPADIGSGTAVLSTTKLPMFFLNLRDTTGELAKWLAEPHLFRSCGAVWHRSQPEASMQPETLSAAYDGFIYLEQTSAARGLP